MLRANKYFRPSSFPWQNVEKATLVAALLWCSLFISGCGTNTFRAPTITRPGATLTLKGQVHGGQQPVSGSAIYLYAEATTANGGTATSLLNAPGYVYTAFDGSFNITNDYTCPAGSYVYLLALGGNPGLGGLLSNNSIAVGAGLGSCASLSASTYISVNEVTTVALAYSLAKFAHSETQIGTNASNALNFQQANQSIADMVDLATGTARTAPVQGYGVVQQAKINSLADSIAPCVNSSGTDGSCAALFAAANVGSGNATPMDTFQAVLQIVQNPTTNVTQVYNLAPPSAPFQPELNAAPADWNLAIQHPAASTVALSPLSASVTQGAQQAFSASIAASGTVSYLWSTTGQQGLLSDGTAPPAASYCATNAYTTYISNAAPVLLSVATDTINVQAFTGAGCVPANQFAAAPAVTVSITPAQSTQTYTGMPTRSQTSMLMMPAGSTMTPDQLTVVTSAGQVTPGPNGAFTAAVYDMGSQIALVQTPSGNPMMLGWIDSTHNTLSPSTTAEVMAYYALGGPLMYTEADRNALEASILNSSALPALTQVIATELGKNPDALINMDQNIATALNTFFTAVTGVTPTAHGAGKAIAAAHPLDTPPVAAGTGIKIQPTSYQSGVFVEQAGAPSTADAMNKYRRRLHAYVTRVSDTDSSGTKVNDPADITDFEISPTVGLNGGVTGAVQDIFATYFGAGATDYGPITSDPFSIPLTSGDQSTTYMVTVVGAGFPNTTYNTLTDKQAQGQYNVAVSGFVGDAVLPFLGNFTFGSGFVGKSDTFTQKLTSALVGDFLNGVPQLPGLKDNILKGNYGDALGQVWDNIRTGGTLREVVIKGLENAAEAKLTSSSALALAFDSFSTILNRAGGILQVWDSAVLAHQLGQSNAADQWTIVNGGQKVTLSPRSTSLSQTGVNVFNLTAALPGLTDTSNISYMWDNTAQAGDLAPAGSNGAGPTPPFCSSQSIMTYTARTSPALQQAVTDTIHVSAYQGANCAIANLLGNSNPATVTVAPSTQVTLSPLKSTIDFGGSATLTTGVSGASAMSFRYTNTATYGTLTDSADATATGRSYCTTGLTQTYQSTATAPVTPAGDDTITVQAFPAPGCTGTPLQPPVSAIVETSTTKNIGVTPRYTPLKAGGNVLLTARFNTLDATGFYYQWSTMAFAGSLTDTGGTGMSGKTSYCSASNQTTYTANSAKVSAPVSDSVQVAAFTSSDCTTGKIGLSAAATVTVSVTPNVLQTPSLLLGSIFASDGYQYAISSSTSNLYSETGGQDSLIRIDANGNTRSVATFQTGHYNSYYGYTMYYADNPYPVIEGPDGYLYGVTTTGGGGDNVGYFFKVSLADYTVTKVHLFTSAEYQANGGAFATQLLLANDGNFYATTSGGVINQITPAGVVTRLYALNTPDGDNASPLIQAADGNLYAIASDAGLEGASGYASPPPPISLVSVSLGGSGNVVYTFPQPTGYNYIPNAPLVAGSDGALYGTIRGERAGFGACEGQPATPGYYGNPGTPCYPIPAATIFRFGTGSGYSTLYTFNQLEDGTFPLAPLVAGPDGFLYGTATSGGDTSVCNLYPNFQLVVNPNGSDTSVGDFGCGSVFRISPQGAFTRMYTFENTFGDGALNRVSGSLVNAPMPLGNYTGNFVDPSGNLLGTSFLENQSNSANDSTLQYSLPLFKQGPIQLTFTPAAAAVGQPVTLNWNVANAFSLTAQQCYAYVQGSAAGAGSWTGLQPGVLDSSGFHGTTSLTLTAPGTYTYALTCGGTQSGFTTLTAQ